jgi:hypothetical protein
MLSPEPMVPLIAARADETRPSDLPYFEKELLTLIHFMCEHILATPLGNQLLHACQA